MSQTQKEDNSNNRSEGNGHSRKIQKKLVDYRRDQVFSLSVKGYSQPKIVSLLNISQGLISSDITYLIRRALEDLADYLEDKLRFIFQESITGISDIISKTWVIMTI